MKLKYFISLILAMSIFLCACNIGGNTAESTDNEETTDLQVNATESQSETDKDTDTETEKQTETETKAETETELKTETEKETETDAPSVNPDEEGYKVLNYDGMKAIWLSQFDLNKIYTNGKSQRSKADFEKRIDKVLDNVKSLGMNTIIVQVRPYADSMYPSQYYPMSGYAVGAYGNEANYDPFAIIIDKAHERSLSVHAWINPMRAMTTSEISKISDKYQIRKWYDDKNTKGKYTVTVKSRVYLNPAYEEVRKLIADGAAEIVKLYDIDGIHMDDYFYPTTDASFDSSAYAQYKKDGGRLAIAPYRRNNVNILVKEIYKAIKDADKDVLFGISPAGNMKNNYNTLYADVYTWCGSEGYIDYICPQVYFGFDHSTVPYAKVCKEFASMIKCDNIRLIIGISLGKAVEPGEDKWAGNGKYEWVENKDVLKRQLEYALNMPECSGICYFCYQYFFVPTTGKEDPRGREEKDNLLPLLRECQWEK